MTSRERVRCVLEGKIPDRVPNGLGACETAGLHLLAYDKLRELKGIHGCPARLDTSMMNAVFEQDVIQAIEGDMILLASPLMCNARLRGPNHEKEWKEQDLWGKKFRVSTKEKFSVLEDGNIFWDSEGGLRCPPGGIYFDAANPGDFKLNYERPSPDNYRPSDHLPDALLRDLEEAAKGLYEETQLSIWCGETVTDLQIGPAGYVGTMMLMRDEPDIMHEFLNKSVQASISQLRQLHQAIGKYVDVLSIAHDLGDNRDVTMGAELWRDIYKPHYMELFHAWKKITGMKINFHSCGSIVNILPDLIECGMDIYNPVQTSAAGMDPQTIKDRFGHKTILYGGAYDSQLRSGDTDYESVHNATRINCEILKASGRYIFAGVHNLPGDMPKWHLAAMLDAWKDTRDYR